MIKSNGDREVIYFTVKIDDAIANIWIKMKKPFDLIWRVIDAGMHLFRGK